jgi:7-carboxy-7-deazaguanine synthase
VPCTFVRLAGCNLRCTWCDSTYTFKGGIRTSIEQVLGEVKALGLPLVEVTGGEPLVHKEAIPLMEGLLKQGHTVLLETSGSRDISMVPAGVHIILDFKPPDSGEERANLWANVAHLKPGKDEVKFVIASRKDFEWSRQKVAEYQLSEKATVLFSPVFGAIKPEALAAWILEDKLPVRFQLQLHKVLWAPEARGV